MREYRDYLRKKKLSQSSIDSYLKALTRLKEWAELENISLNQITHNEMLTYVQYKQSTNSQHSIQLILIRLKTYYNYLLENEIIEINPVHKIEIHGIERQKMYHLLTPKELETLYENYPTLENTNYTSRQLARRRNKVIIGLLIWQGLNSKELSLLTTKHIHLREGRIHIPGARKSNPRELKLQPQQVFDLMDYLQNTLPELSSIPSKTEQYLLTSGQSNDLGNSLHRLVKHLKKINSNVTSLHQIRANVIINWLKKHNLRQVQYMAGHRYVSSTEAYQLNDIEDLQQALNKFHPTEQAFTNHPKP